MSTTKRPVPKPGKRPAPKVPESKSVALTSYSVHVLIAVRVEGGEGIPVYENVLLIQANDAEEAEQRATEIASLEEEEVFRWDGKSARMEFVGIRKVIECQPFGTAKRIGSGAELTYSLLSVGSEADLKKLAAGEPVTVTYSE